MSADKNWHYLINPEADMNTVQQAERIFSAALQAGRIVQLKEMVKEAMNTAQPKCGLCQGWMASTCPREGRDAKGRRTGPSCNGSPCSKFEIVGWAIDLRNERTARAVEFAEKYGLPVPAALSRQS
jgi:hypothetical protein